MPPIGSENKRPDSRSALSRHKSSMGSNYNPNQGRPGALTSSPQLKTLKPVTPYMGMPSQQRGGFSNPAGNTFSALSGILKDSLNAAATARPTVSQTPTSSPVVTQPTARMGTFSGGGGGGIQSTAFMDASTLDTVPSPVIPSAETDPDYQARIAELSKALADMQAQRNLSLGQYDDNYNQGLRTMGWDQVKGMFDRGNTRGLFGQAVDTNANDFGARGLLRSGLYGQADANIASDYSNRKGELDLGRQQYRDSQDLALSNFMGQQEVTKAALLRDAIARIAAQYGVGLDAVPR